MAEGASASKEGAFHMQSTSLIGAVERIAEAAWTGGLALIEEPASTAGPQWTGDPPRGGTEGRRRAGAANRTAG